jgi:hypothetical protein
MPAEQRDRHGPGDARAPGRARPRRPARPRRHHRAPGRAPGHRRALDLDHGAQLRALGHRERSISTTRPSSKRWPSSRAAPAPSASTWASSATTAAVIGEGAAMRERSMPAEPPAPAIVEPPGQVEHLGEHEHGRSDRARPGEPPAQLDHLSSSTRPWASTDPAPSTAAVMPPSSAGRVLRPRHGPGEARNREPGTGSTRRAIGEPRAIVERRARGDAAARCPRPRPPGDGRRARAGSAAGHMMRPVQTTALAC